MHPICTSISQAGFNLSIDFVVAKSGRKIAPSCGHHFKNHPRRTSLKQQGIFRKSGVKTRIAKLRQFCEENPDGSDFCEYRENSPYDIADLVMVFKFFLDVGDRIKILLTLST